MLPTPMLYVFGHAAIFSPHRLPCPQHDPMRPEDLDTAAEDHIADETRYACLAATPDRRPSPERLQHPEVVMRPKLRFRMSV